MNKRSVTPAVLENIWRDILFAIRAMRANPIFAVTAVLTLALGIGGNTAVFTVIRDVLLKPLAYPYPEQLVQVAGGATPTRFNEMKVSTRCFSRLAAFSGEEKLTLAGGTEPEILGGVRVSVSFLNILGIRPVVGRTFLPEDDAPNGAPVVLISSALWNRRFHRDPQIAGSTITLAAMPYTVIGVLPPRFQFPFPGVDAWMTRPSEWPLIPPESRPLSPFLTVFGRLKPQMSMLRANAEMATARRRYAADHPTMLDANAKSPVELMPMKDQLVGDLRAMLWMLFGATSFVLLITCANVAGILLARATSRSREFAVRSALGASRPRLVGQLLVESLLLSLIGGVLGVLLAALSLRALPLMTAFQLPRVTEIHLDWVVLGFSCTLSICAGVLFGLTPSLGASQPDLMRVLRGTGEAGGKGTSRRMLGWFNSRSLLVVAQVALSMVLLIGAGLLMKSLANLRGADVGFNPANLLTLRISVPPVRYDTDRKKAEFFQEVVQQVGSVPGIRSVAAAMFLPMTGFIGSPVQNAAMPPLRLNERRIATILVVSPSYFRTLQIPMRRGRDFAQQDRIGAERVAIIDEAMARRFWPACPGGQDPIGQQLLIGGANPKPARIVGIVADVHQNLENSAWPETAYVPLAQDAQPSAMLAIRTASEPLGFAATVRELVRRVDPDQPVSDVQTMDELVDEQVGQRRLVVGLLGSFAGLAIFLALIGLYGVISYSVAFRVQELGIRRALGAQGLDILQLVMGQGIRLSLAGIAIGMAGALALTRVLKSMLFHVDPADPVTFVVIGLLFAVAAIGATYVPASRALRMDPMTALRNQ